MSSIISIGLLYGQKVYLALPRCECSETVHDLSYTKLGAGYVRKFVDDDDAYMVEVTNNGSSSKINSYCPCSTIDVCCDSTKLELKKIARNHIFVMGIPDQSITFDDQVFHVDDIINVYPFSDKFKIVAINSNADMLLVCSISGIALNGNIDFDSMKIVDLNDAATEISVGDGHPTIPYSYVIYPANNTTPQVDEP